MSIGPILGPYAETGSDICTSQLQAVRVPVSSWYAEPTNNLAWSNY
jgi:hypothetical protein